MNKRVAIVGWRGMVGSVLVDRMREEQLFSHIDPVFCSTSQAGAPAPDLGIDLPPLADAYDVSTLCDTDIVVSCQGGDYSTRMHEEVRKAGYRGAWIDAASALRMRNDSVIVLDPVNQPVMDRARAAGVVDYIGGNCTVSLLLMAIGGLFRQQWVEWVSTMTYQAASGAGARQMRELIAQMDHLSAACRATLKDPGASALDLERTLSAALRGEAMPTEALGHPLAASLLPWIDRGVEHGATREEWKGHVECNKILGNDPEIPVDGICVRVGSMRCHAQAVTIKLRQDVPLDEIEHVLHESTPWTRIVPNTREATLEKLTPAAVSGTLDIPVGRIHKLRMGPEYLGLFTVGDQLLWGAAEPLLRTLQWLL